MLAGKLLNLFANPYASKQDNFMPEGSNALASTALAADRQWSADQAKINRDFQFEMSSTAYQRAVADMQKAGLNPALLFSSGSAASSPAGSMAVSNDSMLQSLDRRWSIEQKQAAALVSAAAQIQTAQINATAKIASSALSLLAKPLPKR